MLVVHTVDARTIEKNIDPGDEEAPLEDGQDVRTILHRSTVDTTEASG